MILETNADLKKYVSIAQSFQFEDFEPYIQKAVNAYTYKYVGNLHTELASFLIVAPVPVASEASSVCKLPTYLYV